MIYNSWGILVSGVLLAVFFIGYFFLKKYKVVKVIFPYK